MTIIEPATRPRIHRAWWVAAITMAALVAAAGFRSSNGALLWTAGGETFPLPVPGRPQTAAWADDDTALVTTYDGEGTAPYGCESAMLRCERQPVDGVEDLSLAR